MERSKKLITIIISLISLFSISVTVYMMISLYLPRWHESRLYKRPTSRLVVEQTTFLHEPGLGKIVGLVAAPPNAPHPQYIYVLGARQALKCTSAGKVLERIRLSSSEAPMQLILSKDGSPVFFLQQGDITSAITLLDARGRERWSRVGWIVSGTAGRYTRPDAYTIAFGQTNEDDTSTLQLLDMQGRALWSVNDRFTGPIVAHDVNGDGNDDIIYGIDNGEQLMVRDGKSHVIKQVKPISRLYNFTLTQWPDAAGRPCILQCDDRLLRLMDFDGKLVKEFLLPNKMSALHSCSGAPVRLLHDATWYYAVVINELVDGPEEQPHLPVMQAHLVVYDQQGAVVYADQLHKPGGEVRAFLAVPKHGHPAQQEILIGTGEGKVLRYTYLRSEAVE